MGGAPSAGLRSEAARPRQRSRASSHPCGISDSTLMRVRTSSERLLSCVEVATMVCGQRAARSTLAPWKARTVMPNTEGSPPTSLSDTRRW
jgi:hypothetical protein